MHDDFVTSRREILAVLFRRKWEVICIFLSCVGTAAFSVYYLISPNYQAEAVILINTSYLTEPLRDGPPESDSEKQAYFRTQSDILTSARIAAEAVRRTNLAQTRVIGRIERIGIFVGDVKRWIGELVGIEKWTAPWDPEAAAIAAVHDFVKTYNLQGSKTLRITFISKDPREAAVVLNALLDAHIEYYYGVVRDKAKGVGTFLEEDFERSRQELKDAENALFEFRRRDRLTAGQAAKPGPADAGDAPSFSGITDSTRVMEEMKLYILKLEEELRTASQIDDNERRERITADLKSRIRVYVDAVNSGPARELELGRLKRQFDIAQETYQLLQRNTAKAKLVAGGETERMNLVEVFERPVERNEVVFPPKRLVMLLSAVLGLVLGLTWAFVMNYLDHTVRSADDVQRYLGVRVIASLPRVR